ncbi:hypothetical protein [Dysgonomonas sp. 25]|uniref:hypothetical protein n=1 Tax=Dysgonomonas sp. 25 TaxID=2302933 RepID=UPI0013D1BC21|nr:hypothetical protein [Dysgonomonas sp. 25]NDV69250.1 hypothetical protein [Dysgonomonas sp. 25]
MKKYLPVISLFVALVATSCASITHYIGYDVKNLDFEYKERRQPEKMLYPAFFYYNTQVTLPAAYKGVIDQQSLSKQIQIEGQRYTDNSRTKDFTVAVSYGVLTTSEVNVRNGVTKTLDERTRDTIYTPSYWIECQYQMNIDASLLKGESKVRNYDLGKALASQPFETKTFANRREALDYWELNKETLTAEFVKGLSSKAIQLLSRELSKDYGYPIYQRIGILVAIDNKKIEESVTFRTRCEELMPKLSALNGTTPLRQSDVQAYIDYFNSLPEKYATLESKEEMRIRFAAYYNLAQIYILLEKPAEAAFYAQKVAENGYAGTVGNDLMSEVEEMQAYFESHSIKTFQFSTDSYFKK